MKNQSKANTTTEAGGMNRALVKAIVFLSVVHLALALSFFIPTGQEKSQAAGIYWSENEGVIAEESVMVPKKVGMIKVTIMYAGGDDKQFDMNYYANQHMPMLQRLFGKALKGYEIDKGMAGRSPDEPIPYLAIGYLYFDKLEDYEKSFGPNAEQILADIPNYTNIQPLVQISEVIK